MDHIGALHDAVITNNYIFNVLHFVVSFSMFVLSITNVIPVSAEFVVASRILGLVKIFGGYYKSRQIIS